MSRTLEYQLKGKSDVEEVVGRAKKSMTTFDKNVEGIQTRFKNFGKDLFLSFLGPMVIFNAGLNYISAQIEKRRQEIEEAKKFAEEAESKFLSAETIALAKERARREREAKEKGLAGRAQTVEMQEALKGQPLTMDEVMLLMSKLSLAEKAAFAFLRGFGLTSEEGMIADLAGRPEMQGAMADILRRRGATQPTTTASQEKSREAKSVSGNVIGVGANPVVEAMTIQLEESRKQTALLEQIANGGAADSSTGWNVTAPAPSRASLLKANR